MACETMQSGARFLGSLLNQLDCQGQTIGAYGFGALSDPTSSVSLALTALLTVFVAIYGIRLALGTPTTGHDLIDNVVRIGIVLTLATSWPAWRTIGYNTVLEGPAEVASLISRSSGLPGGEVLINRLQDVDDRLVAMTIYGTGRLTGGIAGGSDIGDSTRGVAVADQTGFGWGRVAYLLSVIVPWAVTRIGAGILLSLAPLMAGLLLFGGTVGLFIGWLRGLVFVALASLVTSLVGSVQIASIVPWASAVLETRSTNGLVPSAPTELLVIGLAFAFLIVCLMALAGRIAFFSQMPWRRMTGALGGMGVPVEALGRPPTIPASATPNMMLSRAQLISEAVATSMRRDHVNGEPVSRYAMSLDRGRQEMRKGPVEPEVIKPTALGSSFRRSRQRISRAGTHRDKQV